MDPKGEFQGLPVGIYSNILNAQWETKTNTKELEKLLLYPLPSYAENYACVLKRTCARKHASLDLG